MSQTAGSKSPDPDPERAKPYIVCAAIRQKNTGLMVCGPRHYDSVMWSQILSIPHEQFLTLQRLNELPAPNDQIKAWQGAEEGFIDQHGTFYGREEAWQIVKTNGQPLTTDECYGNGCLYSEHLYP